MILSFITDSGHKVTIPFSLICSIVQMNGGETRITVQHNKPGEYYVVKSPDYEALVMYWKAALLHQQPEPPRKP